MIKYFYLLTLVAVGACKTPIRQQDDFQPLVAVEDDGKLVAKQFVLLTNETGNRIEDRLKNNSQLEEKLHEILVTRGSAEPTTRLTRWFNNKSEALANWNIFRKIKNAGPGGSVAIEYPPKQLLSPKAMKFAIVIPVIIGAHIAGRVMGAFVKSPYEKPINPKLKEK